MKLSESIKCVRNLLEFAGQRSGDVSRDDRVVTGAVKTTSNYGSMIEAEYEAHVRVTDGNAMDGRLGGPHTSTPVVDVGDITITEITEYPIQQAGRDYRDPATYRRGDLDAFASIMPRLKDLAEQDAMVRALNA